MASAYDCEVDGIFYNLNKDWNTASVTAYNVHSNNSAYIGTVTIPSSFIYDGKTYNVTNIDRNAFSNCSDLVSVTIPNSVEIIGDFAFYKCVHLKSIFLSDNLKEIRGQAFSGCTTLTEIVIPNNVNVIGDAAFQNCGSLYSIELPNNITSIGANAFENCSSLTTISIPESVTTIPSRAFYGCYSLKSVNIHTNVHSIMGEAFAYCRSLTSLDLSNVKTIGDEVFFRCNNLSSILFSDSIKSIGYATFSETAWYTDHPDGPIYIGPVLYCYKGWMNEDTNFIVKDGTTQISSKAFAGCVGMSSITIPKSLLEIGTDAFWGCINLASVHVSDLTAWCNITFLENSNPLKMAHHLFMNDTEITDLTIPENVTNIAGSTFEECNGLKSVTFGESVRIIGGGAFRGCESLISIILPDSLSCIGDNAFTDCTSLLSAIIPKHCKYIGYRAFSGCTNLMSIVIPQSATSIGYNSFSSCSNLEDVYCYIKPSSASFSSFFNEIYYKGIFLNSSTSTAILHVPASALHLYETHEPWSQFEEIVKLPTYNLIYTVDNEIYATYEIEEDEIISEKNTPPIIPIKESYTFDGWSEIPEKMPAHDVTITGTFTYIDAIEDVSSDDGDYLIFTIDGRPTSTLQKGMNIIRMKDGTVKKVLVK